MGLLFQLVDQLKRFVLNLPVSAAHKKLTFRSKQEDFPNLPVSSDHKNGLRLASPVRVEQAEMRQTAAVYLLGQLQAGDYPSPY